MSNRREIGTAIVTGASSGIGKVYAERLARRGHGLILVARREDRLRQLATELKQRHDVSAEVLIADLSQPADVDAVGMRITDDSSVTLLEFRDAARQQCRLLGVEAADADT